MNQIPSALIDGYVLPYATISPLPSTPNSFSLNQSDSNGVFYRSVGSFGAKFVDDEGEDQVEIKQFKKILELKLHLVYDFSLCKIIPPDS
ncbi:MAG: hypothetical protein EZS28_042327, partial [Streblomastix strix]